MGQRGIKLLSLSSYLTKLCPIIWAWPKIASGYMLHFPQHIYFWSVKVTTRNPPKTVAKNAENVASLSLLFLLSNRMLHLRRMCLPRRKMATKYTDVPLQSHQGSFCLILYFVVKPEARKSVNRSVRPILLFTYFLSPVWKYASIGILIGKHLTT